MTPGTEFLGEALETVAMQMEAPFPEADLPEARMEAEPVPPAAPQPPPQPEQNPLFLVRPDGGLEIASRDVVFVRRGSVVWYSGKLRFAPEASFRGTRLEKILRADGKGHLFVNDPGRQASKRDLAGESLFVEGSRVLALDHGLSFRLEPIHDFRMNRRVDVLKIHGTGSVILSVGGALLAHEVSPEFPLNVSSRDLVAWTGDLVPSVLEDRFLEEVMMPDVGSAPKIRFEGTGTVLTGAAAPSPQSLRPVALGRDRPKELLGAASSQLSAVSTDSVRARRGAVSRSKIRQARLRGVQQRLHERLVLVLAIDPDHRLGSGEPVQQPAAAVEHVLDPVLVPHVRDRLPGDGGGRALEDIAKERGDHGTGRYTSRRP